MFVEQKTFLVPGPNIETGENSLIPNKSTLSINVVHNKADGVTGSVNGVVFDESLVNFITIKYLLYSWVQSLIYVKYYL